MDGEGRIRKMIDNLPNEIVVEEVSLRDGLQIEDRPFSVAEKLRFIRGMEESGIKRIQVGSFVHPKWVPQMANTDEVFAALERKAGITYTALVLNEKGLDRALDCDVALLSMSTSTTETHSRKNTNQTLAEGRERVQILIEKSLKAGVHVRAGVIMAFGCGYEGPVPLEVVEDLVDLYARLGVHEINLADTCGLANPRSIYELVARTRDRVGNDIAILLHLHDTRGFGLANVVAGIQAGATIFDASLGGLGGCPFIQNARGNIATEDVVFMLGEMGISTGIDWKGLSRLTLEMEELLEKTLPSRMAHLPDIAA